MSEQAAGHLDQFPEEHRLFLGALQLRFSQETRAGIVQMPWICEDAVLPVLGGVHDQYRNYRVEVYDLSVGADAHYMFRLVNRASSLHTLSTAVDSTAGYYRNGLGPAIPMSAQAYQGFGELLDETNFSKKRTLEIVENMQALGAVAHFEPFPTLAESRALVRKAYRRRAIGWFLSSQTGTPTFNPECE